MKKAAEGRTATDRRVLRTKSAIRDALKRLLTKKKMEDITVTELSQAADVNRKTFYNYYSGVYAVMDEIEDGVVEQLKDVMDGVDFQMMIRDPADAFHRLDILILGDLEFYRNLMTVENQSSLLAKITETLKQTMWKALSPHFRMDQQMALEISIEYGISGIIASYRRWFRDGQKTDLATITDYISRITLNGILGLAETYR